MAFDEAGSLDTR